MPDELTSASRPARRISTRYPVIAPLLDRYSPRSFLDAMPEPEKLQSMFEAARLAPSAHNSQPTRFMLGRKGQGPTYDLLFDCLDDHNQVWAHRAPVLILASVTRKRFKQETGELVPYSHVMHDLGLAIMSMIVQAQSLGLHCHCLAAFDPDKAQEVFAIPPLYMPALVLVTGYAGPSDVLPPDLIDKEIASRRRRSLEESVFDGVWGQASTLFIE